MAVTGGVPAATFHYAGRAETVALREPLYAPRRPVLDSALLDAALEAGVDAHLGADVTEVERDGTGRVTGVRYRVRGPRGGQYQAGTPAQMQTCPSLVGMMPAVTPGR